MTTVTTTLVSGQNAYVGAVSSRGEYSVSVNSGVQGPTGANGVSITAANVVSGNLVLTLSNTSTIDVGGVVGANGTNGTNGTNGANGVSITAANVVSGNLILTFSNTSTLNVGTVVGANGANGTNGTNGVSVTAASVATGNLIITLSNTSTIDAGVVASGGSTNVNATFAWTNAHTFSNTVTFSGSAVVPSSNTLGTALGSTTQRWVLIANTGTFSGAVSGITTLAAGNTTITGFANVTSTIQGGSSLTIAGNLSGVTTAAMGNTTITGFANVSTTLNVTGNTTLSGTNTYITSTNTTITSNVTITANLNVSGAIVAPAVSNIIPFYYDNQAAFPSAAIYHGALAHSHSDGKMYFAHSSSWQEMVDISSSQTLSNKTITTLAAGNTTITGFANVTSTLQVTGAATLSANLTVSGNIAGNTAGFAIGYRDVPQNFTNTSFTLALTDAGKHILTQNSGSSTQTVTIPPNGTVAFQTGAAITIVVQSTGTVAVANGAGVTMYLTGNSTAKSTVTLNSYSMATLLKIGTDTWMVSGTGAT